MRLARQRVLGKRRRRGRAWPRFRRLAFEPLEARRLLAVLTVNSTADIVALDGLVTLREAIFAANTDTVTELQETGNGADEIRFDPSLFSTGPTTILLENGELSITSDLTVSGPGASVLTIDASGNDPTPDSTLDDGDANDFDGSRVLGIDDNNSETNLSVSIAGLTFTGGDSNSFGGAILNREFLSLASCIISGNVADSGGGIANFLHAGIAGTTVINNQSGNSGGGINNSGSLFLSNSTISGNTARFVGGGFYNFQGQAAIELSTISDNRAEQNGTGAGGGGLANVSGELSVAGCQITGNVTNGGDNSADGGGILNRFGSLAVVASTISGNEANGSGGGVHSAGDATIDISTISGNTAGGDGGGISSRDGDLLITTSTVSGNRAAASGGGIFLVTSADYTTRIAHATVTGNTADDDNDNVGSGGGIFANGTGLLEIAHTIIAGNSDNSDIAPDFDLTTDPPVALDIRYSLVGDNSGSGLDEVPAGSPDEDGNLIGDPDVDGVINPLLGPLADNGGLTPTHALLPGSPAINGGVPNFDPPPDFDQRDSGFPRVVYGRIDIGAFEFADPIPDNFIVDIDDDELDGDFSVGDLSLREALWASNFDPEVRTITFAPNLDGATIVLTMGELAITDSVTIEASSLSGGVTVDASGNDPTPTVNNGDGTRVFHIDDGDGSNRLEVTLRGLTLTGGDISGRGGAVYSVENLTVANCTISGNAAFSGGGIHNNLGTLFVINSTISGNAANHNGGGMALYLNDNSTASILHSTITGNTADFDGNFSSSGGGIYASGSGLLEIGHTIVAGNIDHSGAAPDLDLTTDPPTMVDIRYSLVGDNTGSGLVEAPVDSPDDDGNLIGDPGGGGVIDPRLDALADYGGPTFTHRLQGNSPAIDAGDPNAVAGQEGVPLFDQRGTEFPRIAGLQARHWGV